MKDLSLAGRRSVVMITVNEKWDAWKSAFKYFKIILKRDDQEERNMALKKNELTKEQAKVFTEMRKYHKEVNNTLVRSGEFAVASIYPEYDRMVFPPTVSTNEKLFDWMAARADVNEINHLYGAEGVRISCTHQSFNRKYMTVCSAVIGLLKIDPDIRKVTGRYDGELGCDVLNIVSDSWVLRIVYNGNLEGFHYIETMKKSNKKVTGNPYQAIRTV